MTESFKFGFGHHPYHIFIYKIYHVYMVNNCNHLWVLFYANSGKNLRSVWLETLNSLVSFLKPQPSSRF